MLGPRNINFTDSRREYDTNNTFKNKKIWLIQAARFQHKRSIFITTSINNAGIIPKYCRNRKKNVLTSTREMIQVTQRLSFLSRTESQ